MMPIIQKYIANPSNFKNGRSDNIRYIVIHYTANNGDTAKNNASYFKTNVVKASAHYFVDESSIYQSVEDFDTAYHCGANTNTYRHSYARNGNSLGIEMCSRKDSNGQYYIRDSVMDNTASLVIDIMDKYNIPIENVLRHYDVTGKNCPEPFVRNESLWVNFKSKLLKEVVMDIRYNTLNEIPQWGKDVISKLITKNSFSNPNKLDLSMDMLRLLVIFDRGYSNDVIK